MKYTHAIILILCFLYPVKKSHSQDLKWNIILFTKAYSNENYTEAAQIGKHILISEQNRPKNNERFRLLYKTIRSYSYSSGLDDAYAFVVELEQQPGDQLFKDYITLYKGILSLAVDKNNQAKNTLTSLLEQNNQAILVDSVRAKIYHNLSVIYGLEEQHALRLEFLGKSFELEKKALLNNANFENYNLSVEVYTSTLYNQYKQYETAYRVIQEALSHPFNREIHSYNQALYQTYIDLLLRMGMEKKAQPNINKLSNFYNNKPLNYQDEFANLLITLARFYLNQNNYTYSIRYATEALSITPLNQRTKSIRSSANILLIGAYYDLQQFDKMKFYLVQDIKESKEINNKELADAYLVAGQYFAKLYQDDLAYAYIDSAKYLYYDKLKLPLNRRFENILALAYFELEQYNQCLYHLENVSQIMKANHNYTNFLYWDNAFEKALCHNHLKHYNQAYLIFKEVNNDMIAKYPHLNDLSSTIQDSRFGMLYRKTNIALATNLSHQYETSGGIQILEEAMTYIEEAGKGLELLRSKQNYDRDRLVIGEMYNDFTLQSTNVAMALYDATGIDSYLHQAFAFIQKGKSFALLQGVNEKRYKLNSGVPLDMINALNESKEQYDHYLKRYNEAVFEAKSDSSLIAQLSEKMSEKMGEIDSINFIISRDYPNYKIEEARAPYLSVKEIQKCLGPQQVVVDYYQTPKEIFRFVIDRDSFQSDRLKVDEQFNDDLEFVLKELSTPFVGQHPVTHIQSFASSSYSLYKILLSGIEDKFFGKELIIVPHSELAYLPFETLLTEDYSDKTPRFKEFPWLIKKQTVSYAYNTALLDKYSLEPVRFNKLLAFAPDYKGNTVADSINLNSEQFLDSLLPPLNGAQEEILAIEQHYKTKVFSGRDANKRNFIASMQENDVIHLAMHSLNDEIQPFNSQIVFASEGELSGSFKASEIYNYSIKSPLTILSSCSSGSGQKQKGEGLLSIARAFTFAGVESQVMTLWPVNDASGAIITQGLYAELSKGHNKNVALQESKLSYLANSDGIHSHPYYWANYVLSGNTKPIEQKMPKGFFNILLALAMLSVVILFIYDRRHSR